MHVFSSSWHARIYRAATSRPPENSCGYWAEIVLFSVSMILAVLAITASVCLGLLMAIAAPIAAFFAGSMPWHEAFLFTAAGYGLFLLGLYALSSFDALERLAERAVHLGLWPVRAATRLLSPIWRPIHRALCTPIEFS